MHINQSDFTIFDFETTGLFARTGDKICEIGAIRVDPMGRERSFEALVNPGRAISDGAFRVNGITPEMLEGKPTIQEVLPDFMSFMQGSVLVAYNSRFDVSFLASALGSSREILNDYRVIDVLPLARRFYPGIGGYSLKNVSEFLGIAHEVEHRALADVIVTKKLFEMIKVKLSEEAITEVEDISQIHYQKNVTTEVKAGSKLELIEAAIADKRTIVIKYYSVWKDKATERSITPIELRDGYLVSFCHLRQSVRSFKLEGIGEVRVD